MKADLDNPNIGWETAEEYLSGDVRQKLKTARVYAQTDPTYAENVEALEKVQPKDLTAAEITVKLGLHGSIRKIMKSFYMISCRYRRPTREGTAAISIWLSRYSGWTWICPTISRTKASSPAVSWRRRPMAQGGWMPVPLQNSS